MSHQAKADQDELRCKSSRLGEDGRIVFPESMDAKGPWQLYNRLIDGIPDGLRITDYCLGTNWSYVLAEGAHAGDPLCGVAYTASQGAKRAITCDLRGRSLKEVASLAKSWCFEEATLGIAALNAWYNRPALIDGLGAAYDKPIELPDGSIRKIDAFELLRSEISALDDAHVTVIGHFPHVERVAEYADLTVLERACRDYMDTPDPACEYVLPYTDYAFITGVTLINKTAPRLLELCRNARNGAGAKVIMVGPSAVMSPLLFEYGVSSLSGSVVADPEKVAFACKNGVGQMFGEALQMCNVNAS